MPFTYLLFYEVLDKEPNISTVWFIFTIMGLIGFIFSFFNWRFVFFALLVPIIPTIFFLSEFHDKFIYPAIKQEDPTYLPQTYIAVILSFLLPIIGAVFNLKKYKLK